MMQMLKIVLISSDENHYMAVRRVVSEINFQYNYDIEFIRFGRICSALKKEICNLNCKKIYVLNVTKSNEYLICELSKFIRNTDWNSEIILVKSQDFVLAENWLNVHKLFDVVSAKKDSLSKDIKVICNHNLPDGKFNYSNRNINLNIYYNNILYIYRDTKTRKLIIITENGLYNINIGLKDILKLLDDRFIQVHQSCIANTYRVEKFDWAHNKFILDNGKIVKMLSKRYRCNVENNK